MRHRSVRLAVAASVVLALVPNAASIASAPAATGAQAATGALASAEDSAASSEAVSVVTLPTGEQVSVIGSPGRQRVSLSAPVARGQNLVTTRSGSQVYAYPATVQPYLGTVIDRELFNVSRLATAGSGRQPVRIRYNGSTVKVPGVTVTLAKGGAADGYLTPSSAAAFGRALTKLTLQAEQAEQDQQAGRAQGRSTRTPLFPGVTGISVLGLAPAATGQVGTSAAVTKFPLVIKVIGADGLPAVGSEVTVMNVNDGRKVNAHRTVNANGEARISVPKGTYSAISSYYGNHPVAGAAWLITSVNEFKITDAGRTMTIDHRKATVRASDVTVPKPAGRVAYSLNWSRWDARAKPSVASLDLGFYGDDAVYVAPTPAAKVGKVSFRQAWVLESTSAPSYTYHLATRSTTTPAKPTSFTAAQLGTVKAAYWGENKKKTALSMRDPIFPEDTWLAGMYLRVERGTRRTEYLGSRGGRITWSEGVFGDDSSRDGGAWMSGPDRSIAAGATQTVNWYKGPLASALQKQSVKSGFCWGCRQESRLRLWLTPYVDSDPSHEGSYSYSTKNPPTISRFRLYRNGKQFVNVVNTEGAEVAIPRGKFTYKAVVDLDRRHMDAAQSTRSKTELGFTSSATIGRVMPTSGECHPSCRALPLVEARLALPLRIDGTVAPARSTVTVTVLKAQFAAKSPARSASLQIRPAGKAWTTVKLKAIGSGKYQGTLDSTKLAGLNVDVRFTGANKAGSTFRQTVLRAYTVGAN